jgi:hypothetical protein
MAARSILSEPRAPRAKPSEEETSSTRALRIRIRAFIAGCAAALPVIAGAGWADRRAGTVYEEAAQRDRDSGASASAPRRQRPDNP